jgi:hypothetical protein
LQDSESPSNIQITHFQDDDDAPYIYKSTLAITSINVKSVGFYYCVFNDTLEVNSSNDYDLLEQDYEAKSVYVFVDGEQFFLKKLSPVAPKTLIFN